MEIAGLLLWNTDISPLTPNSTSQTSETIHNNFKETASFPHVNAEREQQQRGEGDVLTAV
jgi:hypothetical protein